MPNKIKAKEGPQKEQGAHVTIIFDSPDNLTESSAAQFAKTLANSFKSVRLLSTSRTAAYTRVPADVPQFSGFEGGELSFVPFEQTLEEIARINEATQANQTATHLISQKIDTALGELETSVGSAKC